MARAMDVESVIESVEGETPCWRVTTRGADGNGLHYVFPKATLEWRAAEYGLDPADIDTLLDVIFHEAYMPNPTDDPTDQAPTLFTATSTADARTAHMARIAKVKTTTAHITSPSTNDPLTIIRNNHGMDPARIRAKREAVDVHRWTKLYGALPVTIEEASRA